jgi:hypothetical protein
MLLRADYIFLYSPNFWEGINTICQPVCVDYIALGKRVMVLDVGGCGIENVMANF